MLCRTRDQGETCEEEAIYYVQGNGVTGHACCHEHGLLWQSRGADLYQLGPAELALEQATLVDSGKKSPHTTRFPIAWLRGLSKRGLLRHGKD